MATSAHETLAYNVDSRLPPKVPPVSFRIGLVADCLIFSVKNAITDLVRFGIFIHVSILIVSNQHS